MLFGQVVKLRLEPKEKIFGSRIAKDFFGREK